MLTGNDAMERNVVHTIRVSTYRDRELNMARFTTSMKRFNNEDQISHTESLYVIDQSIIVFNSDLVDSTTMTDCTDTCLSMRLNLHDGTCVDEKFLASAL